MKGFREHICCPLSFLTNPFSKKIGSEGLCLRVSVQAMKKTMETVLETGLRSLLQTRTDNLIDFSFNRGVTNLLSEFLLPHLINMPHSKKFCWLPRPLHRYPGVVKLVGHIIQFVPILDKPKNKQRQVPRWKKWFWRAQLLTIIVIIFINIKHFPAYYYKWTKWFME